MVEPAAFPDKPHARRFLFSGMAGEALNTAALLTSNLLAPTWLPLLVFGEYARDLAPAFLALGLIDAPMAARMLVASDEGVRGLIVRKFAMTLACSGVLALLFGAAVGAALLVAAGYSASSAVVHLALRRGIGFGSPVLCATLLAATVATLWLGSSLELSGTAVAAIQGILALLASVGIGTSVARSVGSPYVSPVIKPSTLMLAIPSYLGGVTQWALVGLVGLAQGPAEAAFARVGTSLLSAPLAAVPMSGALLLAYARRHGRASSASRRAILVGTGLAVVAAAVGSLVSPALPEILGEEFRPLVPLVPVLLACGVGGTAVHLCWPTLVTVLPSMRSRVVASLTASILTAAAVPVGLLGWESGLMALSLAYLIVGSAVLALTLRRL